MVLDCWIFFIALQWLRRKADVSKDMKEMEDESLSEEAESFTIMKLLRSSELRPPLLVAVVLQLAQQLSGINAVSSQAVARLSKCFP